MSDFGEIGSHLTSALCLEFQSLLGARVIGVTESLEDFDVESFLEVRLDPVLESLHMVGKVGGLKEVVLQLAEVLEGGEILQVAVDTSILDLFLLLLEHGVFITRFELLVQVGDCLHEGPQSLVHLPLDGVEVLLREVWVYPLTKLLMVVMLVVRFRQR